MFGIIAAVAFALAYLLHGFAAGNEWIGWQALLLAGLFFLALHFVTGVAVPWRRTPPG